MSGLNIPTVLKDANVYLEGADFLGKSDIELPAVTQKEVDYSGMGISGTLGLPVSGHIEKMEGVLRFHFVDKDIADKVFDPSQPYLLEVRASYQEYDNSTGRMDEKPVRVTMKVFFKDFPMGGIKPGENNTMDIKYNAIYYKYVVDGIEVLEVDPLNYIYKVNGKNILQKTRTNIGL